MSSRVLFTVGVAVAACSGPPGQPVPLAPMPAPVPEPEPEPGPPDPPVQRRIELTFAGDVMFGGWFHDRFRHVPVDELDPLAAVDALLASDLAVVNLETPVVAEIPTDVTGHLRFVATPEQIAVLPRHGIGAVTIANNHANDVGDQGLDETPVHLRALGLRVLGAADGAPFRVETIDVDGWRIAFVAATVKLNRKASLERIPWVRGEKLVETIGPLVADARDEHDLVIVFLHWGEERADEPAPWQVDAARALIDAGAAAVIGSHPHVLQRIERYGAGVIAYSLGNFVFRNIEQPQRLTGVLRLAFDRDRRCLALASFHPAVMRGGLVAHPVPAEGATFTQVVDRLTTLSHGTDWFPAGDRIVTPGGC